MKSKSEDHLVQCPYYKANTGQVIRCEGLEDGMSTCLTFASHGKMVGYKSRFCRRLDCWANCPVAQTLNKKWGYEE